MGRLNSRKDAQNAQGATSARGALWNAPVRRTAESGVALRLPPHSKKEGPTAALGQWPTCRGRAGGIRRPAIWGHGAICFAASASRPRRSTPGPGFGHEAGRIPSAVAGGPCVRSWTQRETADNTQRKPLLLLALSGVFLLRFADRQLLSLLFHDPPRRTRLGATRSRSQRSTRWKLRM